MGNKLNNLKRYLIGFLIGISFLMGVSYASTGTIGGLFEKISGNWKLVGTNIKDGTVGNQQLGNNSVTTTRIVNKNVTEEKLADDIVAKLNSPIDPTAVKLTGNQTIGGIKTFTSSPIVPNPTTAMQVANKAYVDSAIAASSSSTSSGGPTYTYNWNTLSWGACSVSCGTGIQARSVTCQRNDGAVVSDSFCTGVKPSLTQSCYPGACSSSSTSSGGPSYTYSWSTGSWSTCNCSTYTQTRSVTCQRNDGAVVTDSFCTNKPSTSQTCSLSSCPCNSGNLVRTSPDGSNSCTGTWNLTPALSSTTGNMTNGGTLQGICNGSNTWNWSYTCPNKIPIVNCYGGGGYSYSSDNTNSCYFSRPTRSVGQTYSVAGTNGGYVSGTCGASGAWDFSMTCPGTVISCPAGGGTIPSNTGKSSCTFYWNPTTAGQWAYATSPNGGTISARCESSGSWGSVSTYCP